MSTGGPRETAAYRFDLPQHAIATAPAEPRDSARLLVVRQSGPFEELVFRDIVSLLRTGDVLVINETRVVRARLRGRRESGGAAEVLLLRPADAPRYASQSRRWQCLVQPGRRLRPGSVIRFGDNARAIVGETSADGLREVVLEIEGTLEAFLDAYGELPLPPYVGPGDEARAQKYQTIFARVPGSVAAPTASLHFTGSVFDSIRARGVEVAPLVLDVGLGTFKPIESASIDDHRMHAESFSIPPDTALAVRRAKEEGRRVVAAGTTVLRALEGAYRLRGAIEAVDGDTDVYITPGFEFGVVDVLVTNFHLPGSTLLTLVCAFAGYARTMEAYAFAVREGFRFFSFGDAMFVARQGSS